MKKSTLKSIISIINLIWQEKYDKIYTVKIIRLIPKKLNYNGMMNYGEFKRNTD